MGMHNIMENDVEQASCPPPPRIFQAYGRDNKMDPRISLPPSIRIRIQKRIRTDNQEIKIGLKF